MTLSDQDIERIAEALLKKLIEHKDTFQGEVTNEYILQDEMGNSKHVTEKEYYMFELENLMRLERMYAEAEEYEKANIIKNKILKIKLKLSKL